MENYFNVPKEIKEKCIMNAKESGYEVLLVIKESNHPEDNYLYLVIAYKSNAIKGYKYCCWVYNRALNLGFYSDSFKEVMDKLSKRIKYIGDYENE